MSELRFQLRQCVSRAWVINHFLRNIFQNTLFSFLLHNKYFDIISFIKIYLTSTTTKKTLWNLSAKSMKTNMKTPLYSSTSLRNKTLLYSCRELSHIMQIIFNDTIIPLESVFSTIKKIIWKSTCSIKKCIYFLKYSILRINIIALKSLFFWWPCGSV